MAFNNQYQNSFKSTQILYYAMLAGQFFIGIMIMYLLEGEIERTPEIPFSYIIPGAVIFGIVASYFMGQHKKSTIPLDESIEEKLTHFRTSNIMKWALSEGGNLMSLVLTFTMANKSFLIWFGIGMAFFILLRPNKEQFKMDYNIQQGTEFE